MSRMSRAVILTLLIHSTPMWAQRSDRRVVGAREIAAAGWHRLGDIVSALPPGSMASIDGFNHELTIGGVPFAGPQTRSVASWTIRLDGQRIPAVIDGLWILDALPVSMTQLDSVVVTRGPGLVDGRAGFLGTIDLFTRRPSRGISGVADYQHGDESGDPGPYRYTSRGSSNVEKLGPFANGAAAFSAPRWSVDGAARYSSLNITDVRIINRFDPSVYAQLQPFVTMVGGSGMLTTTVAGGTQHTLAGRGRYTGLTWIPSIADEQSVKVIASSAGTSGDASFGKIRARYGLTGTRLETSELQSSLAFSAAHARTMTDAFIEASASQPLSIGAGLASWTHERGGASETRVSERIWTAYRRGDATASIAGAIANGHISLSGSAGLDLRLRDSLILNVRGTHLSAPSDGDDAWIRANGATVAFQRAVSLTEARAELTTHRFRHVVPSVTGRVFGLRGFDATDGSNRPRVAAGARLSTVGGSRITGFAEGEVITTTGSSHPADGMTPTAYVEGGASAVVGGDFLVAASGRLTDRMEWPVVRSGARTDVPPLRRVDVSLNKPFWHRRVRAQLVVRNLFDVDEIYHPLGAQWNLRSHLAVTVALPPYRSPQPETPR